MKEPKTIDEIVEKAIEDIYDQIQLLFDSPPEKEAGGDIADIIRAACEAWAAQMGAGSGLEEIAEETARGLMRYYYGGCKPDALKLFSTHILTALRKAVAAYEVALREIMAMEKRHQKTPYEVGFNECLNSAKRIAARALPGGEAQGESDDKAE